MAFTGGQQLLAEGGDGGSDLRVAGQILLGADDSHVGGVRLALRQVVDAGHGEGCRRAVRRLQPSWVSSTMMKPASMSMSHFMMEELLVVSWMQQASLPPSMTWISRLSTLLLLLLLLSVAVCWFWSPAPPCLLLS